MVVNSLSGSRAEGGEIARGMTSFGAAELQLPPWLAGLVTTSERRPDGPSTKGPGWSARGGDRVVAVGQR